MYPIKKGSIDQSIEVFIQDSTAVDGSGLTGLVFNSSNLTCYYHRPGAASAQLALVTQTVTGAHTDGGFVEIDATNMPGKYRLDLSDAIAASGVGYVDLHLRGATNMADLPIKILLWGLDPNDSVGRAVHGRDVRYVSTAGSDANDGLSFDQADLTVTAAVAASSNGDMIIVGPGTFDEAVDLSSLSAITLTVTPGATITQSSGSTVTLGAACTVVGGGILEQTGTATAEAVYASGKSNVVIRGMRIVSSEKGIRLISGCDYALIEGNQIAASEYGVHLVNNSNSVVRDNRIGCAGWTTCASAGIYVSMGDALCEDNTVAASVPVGDSSHAVSGIETFGGKITSINNHATATAITGGYAYAAYIHDSSPTMDIIGGSYQATAADHAYDLSQAAGPMRVSGAAYDPDKTSGTITVVGSNVTAIDDSATAAEYLKDVLSGTGRALTLSQLRIDSDVAAGAVQITNSAGYGISVASVGQHAVYLNAMSGDHAGLIVSASGGATDIMADILGTLSTVTTCTTGALASVCTEARLAELDAGNLPADVDWIKNERIGNWEIVNDQLIISKEDDSELVRFNLFDAADNASSSNVRKRTRVP